jgi:hypothetical protein
MEFYYRRKIAPFYGMENSVRIIHFGKRPDVEGIRERRNQSPALSHLETYMARVWPVPFWQGLILFIDGFFYRCERWLKRVAHAEN